jgi:hypothetical protein
LKVERRFDPVLKKSGCQPWKRRTAVKKAYRTIRKQGKVNEQELASFLVKNGQGLLPMVDLIEQCQMACNELIDVTGRAAIQAVLQLSAMEAGRAER